MKKLMMTFNLCLCFYLFSFAQQTVNRDYKYTVHFETDQDQMTTHAKSKLEKRLSNYIAKDIQSIRIIGHADARGDSDYNVALSQRRTLAVQDFLHQNGFNRFIIPTDYKGETEPLIIDYSDMGLQANRRVEIWFTINEMTAEPTHTIISSTTTDAVVVPERVIKQTEKSLTNYQKFHQKIDKDNSNFNLDNEAGGLINAKEGTVIHFYPNSFCDCNTKENIEGKINIKLKEYYQISDFIQAGLSTNSNGRMLQSAGTIYIAAFQNNQKICLKKNQEYHILFPKNKMNEKDYNDMNLFTGNMDDKGEINWGVMQKNGLMNMPAINLQQNPNSEYSDCDKLKFFPRIRQFFANHSSWKDYKFCRSEEGQLLLQRNRAARNLYSSRRKFILNRFENKFEELVEELGKGWEKYLFNYYVTSATRLNYINCDRFINYPRTQLEIVSIPLDYKKDISVKIIIKSVNGILSGYPAGKRKYVFGKLPRGEKAKILVYDYSGEKPKVAKHHFNIGETVTSEHLVFEEYSMDKFKKHILTLD